jgi:hypothetical protein
MTFRDEMGENEPARKHALVVAGMHRSGTSAMARVLSLAGAALPTRLMPPGPANSEGHWEPLDVAALNDEIFGKVDSSWHDLFGPRNIRNRKPPIHRYLPRARKIIQDNYRNEDLIVLKDPRISIFPELWHRALIDEGYSVYYVLMIRHPKEIADSLKARNGFTVNKSLILWATHMLSVDLFTRRKNRVFVNYDELLLDTESLLDKIEDAFKIQMPRRTWTSMISIQDFVNSAHRHHKTDNDDNALPAFPEIERFYAYLTATAKGEIWNEDVSADLAEWLSRLESATAPIIKGLESTLAANSAHSAARETQLEQGIERLETALREAQQISNDLSGRLEEARRHQAHLETVHESVKAGLTEQLAHSEQRILALEASLEAARHESSEHKARFLGEAQNLSDELSHARAQIEESEARASAATLAQADLTAAFTGQLAHSEQRILALEASFEAARQELSEHKTHFLAEGQNLSEALNHAKAQVEEAEARASAAARAQADLATAHAAETLELTARLTSLSSEIEDAKRVAERAANEAAQTSMERAEAVQTAADLSERLSDTLRIVADKDAALASSGAELAALTHSAASQEAELRRRIAEDQGHSLEMERRLLDAEARVAQIAIEKSAAETAIQELHATLERSITAALRRRLARWWPR